MKELHKFHLSFEELFRKVERLKFFLNHEKVYCIYYFSFRTVFDYANTYEELIEKYLPSDKKLATFITIQKQLHGDYSFDKDKRIKEINNSNDLMFFTVIKERVDKILPILTEELRDAIRHLVIQERDEYIKIGGKIRK